MDTLTSFCDELHHSLDGVNPLQHHCIYLGFESTKKGVETTIMKVNKNHWHDGRDILQQKKKEKEKKKQQKKENKRIIKQKDKNRNKPENTKLK